MWVWPIPAWHLPLGAGRGDIALGWRMRHVEKELAENNFFLIFCFFFSFQIHHESTQGIFVGVEIDFLFLPLGIHLFITHCEIYVRLCKTLVCFQNIFKFIFWQISGPILFLFIESRLFHTIFWLVSTSLTSRFSSLPHISNLHSFPISFLSEYKQTSKEK